MNKTTAFRNRTKKLNNVIKQDLQDLWEVPRYQWTAEHSLEVYKLEFTTRLIDNALDYENHYLWGGGGDWVEMYEYSDGMKRIANDALEHIFKIENIYKTDTNKLGMHMRYLDEVIYHDPMTREMMKLAYDTLPEEIHTDFYYFSETENKNVGCDDPHGHGNDAEPCEHIHTNDEYHHWLDWNSEDIVNLTLEKYNTQFTWLGDYPDYLNFVGFNECNKRGCCDQ